MYKEIFDRSTDGMLILEEGIIAECNDAMVSMLGYKSKEELVGAECEVLNPEFQPDGKSSAAKAQEKANEAALKGNCTFEWVHLSADGEPFWVEVVLTDMSTDETQRFLSVWREIGEKKRLEEENSYQRMLLSSVLNSSSDLIFYKDYKNENGKYMGCNTAYEALLGKRRDEIVGYTDFEIFGDEQGKAFRDNDEKVLENKTIATNEVWLRYPSGEEVLFHTMKSLLVDAHGNTIGVIGIARDITNTYNYQKALEESTQRHKVLADTDPLTGIMNRRAIFNATDTLSDKENVAVLMIDVDDFKQINDTYGHETGDTVLKNIVAVCSKNIREDDLFGRLGGEEFVIVLHNTNERKAKETTSRLLKEIAKERISDADISVTVSIGMVMCDQNKYSSFSQMLNDADKTLYRAKASGKNQYQLFSNSRRTS